MIFHTKPWAYTTQFCSKHPAFLIGLCFLLGATCAFHWHFALLTQLAPYLTQETKREVQDTRFATNRRSSDLGEEQSVVDCASQLVYWVMSSKNYMTKLNE
jgi:hypothetical protein